VLVTDFTIAAQAPENIDIIIAIIIIAKNKYDKKSFFMKMRTAAPAFIKTNHLNDILFGAENHIRPKLRKTATMIKSAISPAVIKTSLIFWVPRFE
jgi:hypothetical protein